MRIAEHVYISEILRPGRDRLIERIREGKKIPALYCITLPVWDYGVLEIYEYNQLLSSFYREKKIVIAGMAAGRQDALVVVSRMAEILHRQNCLGDAALYFGGVIK